MPLILVIDIDYSVNIDDDAVMSRPRQFDECEALDAALATFWRCGYDGCSMDDLLAATGLQRQSLYNAFGDKQSLFLAVLARYSRKAAEALEPLRATGAGLVELRRYMEAVLAMQRQGKFGACLMVKTALAGQNTDPRIRRTVEVTAAAVRAAFTTVVERLIRNRQLSSDTDAEASAAYLYAVLNGLSALAQTGGAKKTGAVLDQTFATFKDRK